MTFKLEELITIYPDELYLEVSPQQRDEAWSQTHNYSNQAARWNAYLNLLALKVFVAYLQEDPDLLRDAGTRRHGDAEKERFPALVVRESLWESDLKEQPLSIELNDIDPRLSSIWEFLNGTAIKLGKTRLVIIPEEVTVINELSVPQEWVDIPDWAADYYLGMAINLEDGWLRIYGYATHRKLKEQGKYEPMGRTYALGEDDLIEDIDVMWVARELCAPERAEIAPLSQLSLAQAEKLIAQLGQPSAYSPRLNTAFAPWAMLLVNEQWRQKLYQQRLAVVQMLASAPSLDVGAANTPLTNLGKLLQNFLEDGWCTVEEARKQLGTTEPQLAYRFGGTSLPDHSPSIPKAVPVLLELLQTNQDPETCFKAIDLLGEIGQGNKDAIATLGELANTSPEQELRRQAAVVLGKIAPTNPQAGMRRVKLIDWGMQLDGNRVALVITFLPEANGETNVHLRVYPAGERNYLPSNLQLMVLNDQGAIFLEAQSRKADSWIQLELTGEYEDSFMVKLILGEAIFTKEFVL